MTSRCVVSLSVTAAVAVVASAAAGVLGYALGLEATWWLAGGVFAVACLVGIAAAVRAQRARGKGDGRSRFVMEDTAGITIGGLSVEEYLARGAARKRERGGDADARR